MDNSLYAASNETESLKALVLSIIQGDQDYGRLLDYLEPATRDALDSETALTLALLLDDVARQAELNDRLHALLKDDGAPALVLSEAGVVLAQNPAAVALFGEAKGDSLMRLGVSRREFSDFQQRIVQHQGPSLLRIFPSVGQPPVMFVGSYQADHQLFVLRSIDCQWPQSIDRALEDLFSLTAAERDILACLAQGMNSDQISQRRRRSIGTVRQQIKSLLAKLGASSQVQAAALASALANQSQEASASSDQPARLSSSPLTLGELVTGTRRLGWRRYGKAGGQPVLLMHGAYFGAGEYEPERALAAEQGLDVVVIERPGYGRTQPPARGADLVDTHLSDGLAVMDHLGWRSASLISHDFGFVPAAALAARHPQRVRALLAISPPAPYDSSDSLEHIPRQQRMFIWAGRHASWMVRLLLRLAQVKARNQGAEHWMDITFEGAPHELPVFREEEGQRLAVGAYGLNHQQNGHGQELDVLMTMARDWSGELADLQVPVRALLGGRNQTFPPADVRRLAALAPALQLEEIPEAGLTLCLTHTRRCFAALMELQRQP